MPCSWMSHLLFTFVDFTTNQLMKWLWIIHSFFYFICIAYLPCRCPCWRDKDNSNIIVYHNEGPYLQQAFSATIFFHTFIRLVSNYNCCMQLLNHTKSMRVSPHNTRDHKRTAVTGLTYFTCRQNNTSQLRNRTHPLMTSCWIDTSLFKTDMQLYIGLLSYLWQKQQ